MIIFHLTYDMSGRAMRTLSKFTPSMEVYSIDEAFLDFQNMPYDLTEFAQEICYTLRKNKKILLNPEPQPSAERLKIHTKKKRAF